MQAIQCGPLQQTNGICFIFCLYFLQLYRPRECWLYQSEEIQKSRFSFLKAGSESYKLQRSKVNFTLLNLVNLIHTIEQLSSIRVQVNRVYRKIDIRYMC